MSSENSSPSDTDGSMMAFFRRFEQSSAAGDVDALVSLYAPSFLMAAPSGAQVVKAGDLAQAIPRRKQMFAAAGCTATTLQSVVDTPLDSRYSLVRTEWQWTFDRPGVTPTKITLPSTFIVDRAAGGPKIVCYINHADIQAILSDRGMLPT